MGATLARLTRFYGGSPWSWWAEIPRYVVDACVAMLPRLTAEESLLAIQRVGVGTGSLEQETSRAMVRGWQRDINDGDTPVAPRAEKPTPDELSAMGIGVRTATKR